MNHFILENIEQIINNGIETSPRGLKQKECLATKSILNWPSNRIFSSPYRKTDLYYALGEFFWYLSGSNSLEFIAYYAPSIRKFSDDGKTLNSAYGYQIFSKYGNQFEHIRKMLESDPDTRQALIMLRSPVNIFEKTKDQICTCTLQFFIREEKLHLIVYMRSNDLMVGALFDVFCFTMLQELMSVILKVNLGTYCHLAGSLHIYEPWYEKAEKILAAPSECFGIPMPKMEFKNEIWDEIHKVLMFEESLRHIKTSDFLWEIVEGILVQSFTDYWKNILLFLATKKSKLLNDSELTAKIFSQITHTYLKETK